MERAECRSVDDLVPVKKPRLSDSTSTILQLDASQKHEASGVGSTNSNISVPTTSHCSNVPLNVKQCKSEVPEQQKDENSDDSDSEASESDWQPSTNGAMEWVHSQMLAGAEPRKILSKLVPDVTSIPPNVNMWTIWKLIINLLSEPKRRKKLSDVNTLDDAVHLIRTSKKILVLTGAGVSMSCGIPDFRSRDGIYARLSVDFPDLPNPQAMFDIHYFKRDPRPFFKF
uniref:Deacetylase sirtuin-type domain-containing protein n=1 Tax=Ciona savignyi TaxID=51511 RepID=H2YKE0_CIOSA